MASYTPNYNLKKPAGTDVVDIDDLNGNMDIIDTQLNSLNSNMVNKENITVLTGTTGNAVGTGTEITLPSGYTASNTVVIGMQYDDNGTWRVFGMLNASAPCIISTTILSNNRISIIPRDNAGLNRNVKVTVFRYTT